MTDRPSRTALPSAPVDLVAVVVGGSQVILAWTECGADVGGLGFRIRRAVCSSPCEKFVEIGKVGQHVAAFRDGFVGPCTTYHYQVCSWNASGDSPPSNLVEVTTPNESEPSDDED